MKKLSALLMLLACATQTLAAGITVNTSTYGSLKAELGNLAYSVDKISVIGPVDASDFATMWHCAYKGKLVEIDLTFASIKDATVPSFAFFHPDEQLSASGYTVLPLRSVILPSDVLEIGSGAFAYTQIEAMTLPSSLEMLGAEAFTGCSRLAGTLTLPDRVSVVPADCFRGCIALESVSLTTSIRAIQPGAFADSGIRNIDMPKGLRVIGDGAFRRTRNLEIISIPNSCTEIGSGAFSGCSSLTYLQLPDHLTVIPADLAAYCSSLLAVDFPVDLTQIGPDAFRNCSSLRSVVLPDNLDCIAMRAFEYSGLDYIALPATIKSVAQGFISNCRNLKAIYCASPIPPLAGEPPYNDGDKPANIISSVRWTPFYAVDKGLPVYVPAHCSNTYKEEWGWDYFSNYNELPEGFDIHDINAIEQLHSDTDVPQLTSGNGYIYLTTGSSGKAFDFSIFSLDGRKIAAGLCQDTVTIPCATGLYIVNAAHSSFKITVK